MALDDNIETSGAPTAMPPFDILDDALAGIEETLQRNGIPRFVESLPHERIRWSNPVYTKMYGELSLQAARAIRSGYDAGLDQSAE